MSPPSDSQSRPVDDAASAALATAKEIIAAQQAQIEVLKELVASLTSRVAELERQLGQTSTNSGQPPSSDGLQKPPRTQSLRAPSGKKSGGQRGHPGKTLRQVENPDAATDHFPETCTGCGAALNETMATGHAARQVFDLPDPKPLLVTEHRAHTCRCSRCGTQTKAAFPESVTAPAQYGPRIEAFVLYLQPPVTAREALGHADGRPLQREADHRDHRPDQPGLCRTVSGLCRYTARASGQGTGQAHGRNRLPRRRQDAVAARCIDFPAGILSRLIETRQPDGERLRNCRARPLEAVLHNERRAARAVQRASPARVEGPGRDREGKLGRPDATSAADSLQRGARGGRDAETGADYYDRAALRCDRRRGTGAPRGATRAGESRQTRTSAATSGTQPAAAPSHPQAGRASLSDRPDRAIHQQPGRAGRANDESAAENLGRLSIRRRCEKLCHDPLRPLDCKKARVELDRGLDERSV